MKELHKKHPSVSFRRLRRSPDSTDTKEEREREVALIENLEKTEIPSAPMLTPTKNNRDSYANPAGTYNELYDTNVVKIRYKIAAVRTAYNVMSNEILRISYVYFRTPLGCRRVMI